MTSTTTDAPTTCVCCGRRATNHSPRVERGRMHLDCWDEHHSDPTGVWPPTHTCADGRDD